MAAVTYILANGARLTVNAAPGASVMQTALANRIPGIIGECGGNMICGTCHVYLDPAWAARLAPIGAHEDAVLDDAAAPRRETSRLGCQIALTGDLDGLIVEIAERQT